MPTLCLTSPDDALIAASAVRTFAAALAAEEPARDVRVVELRGEHCKLGVSDRDAYREAIRAHISRARGAMEAQQAARAAEGWLALLQRHALETLLEQMAFDDAAAFEEDDYPLEDAFALLASGGRAALLQKLKALGVAALPLRQKLASAIAKEAKGRQSMRLAASPSAGMPLASVASQRVAS